MLDDDTVDAATTLRAVHALAGIANAWTKAHEHHELQKQVETLRADLDAMKRRQETEHREIAA